MSKGRLHVCDSESRKPHEKIDKEINKVALVVSAFFACVARYRGTEIPLFLAHHCKDDAFADLVLHITPQSEHATERCSTPFVFGRAVVDALAPKVYKLQLPVIAQGRCGCLSSGP